MPPKPSRQITGLDFIRTAAALMVMLFHLGFWIWRAVPPFAVPAAYRRLAPLCSAGWVGVEIFFVISGFVIAYSIQETTPTQFVRHRISRLIPTALVCATITAAVLLTAYRLSAVAIWWAKSVILSPVGPWVDGTYWTLPIEVAFYGLVLLLLVFRRGKAFSGTMAAMGALSSAFCILLVLPAGRWSGPLDRFAAAASFPPLACLLPVYGCFFGLGVFLYLSLLKGITRFRGWMLVLCGAGCFAELVHHGLSFERQFGGGYVMISATGLWLFSVLALVCSVWFNSGLQHILGIRGVRLARRMGVATYALYLLHAKLGQVAIGGLHRLVGYGWALAISIVSVSLGAVIVSQVIEPKLRAGLEWLWDVATEKVNRKAPVEQLHS